jgi:hypothetical protein
MESSRQSGFIKRTLAAAAADRSGNPRAFAFLAVHNHDGGCGQMQKSPAGKFHGQPVTPQKLSQFLCAKKASKTSAIGHSQTFDNVRCSVAIGGKADFATGLSEPDYL